MYGLQNGVTQCGFFAVIATIILLLVTLCEHALCFPKVNF